jgi:CubicO group peptidase (beta-lactamase class C family)
MKKTFLLLLLPFALYAQNNTSFFDAYMQAQTDLYGFNGNVLVSKNGNVIYKKSFGYADYNTKRKLESNSIFDCGSIAKEFTAMGIMLLKDRDKIKYTDTLRKFFPELPYNNITVHQLLTHTSGLPEGFALVSKNFDHNKIAHNNDMIRLLASEKPPVLFKPGENMMYSGTAFVLLASIIEKISAKSYKTYMDEQVFKPLGMTHTLVANGSRSTEAIPGYAYGFVYSDSLKNFVRADSLQSSGWTRYLGGIAGEGIIISTTGDLLKWDRALKNHSLLSETTQQEMLSTQAEKNTIPKVSFGYGIRVGKNDFGNYIFHNGSWPGYSSMLIRYMDDDLTVIVLSNNESRSDFIADALSAIALNKNIVLPYVHKEAVIDTGLSKYGGKYMMQLERPPYMATYPIEFVKKNDKLYIHPGSGPDTELKSESGKKFFFANGTDQQIEFETDISGNPVRVWHIAWGVKKELKKIE